MITKANERDTEIRKDVAVHVGKSTVEHLFLENDMRNVRLCAAITLEPGASIADHYHHDESELYLILSGSGTIHDDDVEMVLNQGDAQYCHDGHRHGIVNHTKKPMTFLGVVVR